MGNKQPTKPKTSGIIGIIIGIKAEIHGIQKKNMENQNLKISVLERSAKFMSL